MKSKYLMLGFVLILLSCYIITQAVFLKFYEYYKLPFGKSDIDNYVLFYYYGSDYVHWFFIGFCRVFIGLFSLLGYEYSFMEFLNFFIPFYGWFCLPACMFVFAYTFFEDGKKSLLATYFLFFGTYFVYAYLIVSTLSQYLSISFFLLLFALVFNSVKEGFNVRRFLGVFILSLLLCVSHPYSFIALCFILLVAGVFVFGLKYVLPFIVPLGLGLWWIGYDLLGYTILAPHYAQSTFSVNLFVFLCPWLLLVLLSGFKVFKSSLLRLPLFFVCVLLLFACVSHSGRLLPFVLPFVCLVVVLVVERWYFLLLDRFWFWFGLVCLCVLCLFYSEGVVRFLLSGLVGELSCVPGVLCRGLGVGGVRGWLLFVVEVRTSVFLPPSV